MEKSDVQVTELSGKILLERAKGNKKGVCVSVCVLDSVVTSER